MTGSWGRRVAAATLTGAVLLSPHSIETQGSTLNGHTVRLDASGKILAWTADQSTAYDDILSLNTTFLTTGVPNGSNGLKLYYSYAWADPNTLAAGDGSHNPAGLFGMLSESALAYSAYSGNPAMMTLVGNLLTYDLDHGLTASTDNWPTVPYACGAPGATTYAGDPGGNTYGNGDGAGVIEPDKTAEVGLAFLKYYEYSGQTRFRDEASHIADVLVSHVRPGDATHSPWPFRVYSATNTIREEYTANAVAPIKLFDELIRLGIGDVQGYTSTRSTALTWLMTYPIVNNTWSNYFEDVPIQSNLSNTTQLIAGETAKYLMLHPEGDASWQTHVRGIVSWIEAQFGGTAFGATTIKEQQQFLYPMGSHTSRYAAVNAMLAELTGDAAAKEKAYRSFNWASYMVRSDGRTIDGPDVNHMWWTDGFGDLIRQFMIGMGAFPEWAPPNENHLLRSTSVVRSVTYAAGDITYDTFDAAATDVLRVAFVPQSVTADGVLLTSRSDLLAEGWTYDAVLGVVRVRHDSGHQIHVSSSVQSGNTPPTVDLTAPADGSTYAAPATIDLSANAADSDGAVARVEFTANSVTIGQSPGPAFAFTWSNVAAGTYALAAVAVDDQGARTASAPISITVTGNTPPAVQVTQPTANQQFTAPADVPVTVSASDADGIKNVQVLLDGSVVATLTASPYTMTLPAVAAGTHSVSAIATDNPGAATTSAVSITVNPGLPTPWTDTDIGSVGMRGSGTLDGGVFTVKGSGVIASTTDALNFVYQPFSGDVDIRARVTAVQNTNAYAMAGVMIRESLASNARQALAILTASQGTVFLRRTSPGAASAYTMGAPGSAPQWVRLLRQGSTITAYRSTNGTSWTSMGSATVAFPQAIYVGLAVASQVNNVTSTSTFDQVTVAGSADTQAPQVQLTAPANGATVGGTNLSVTATATDNVGVTSVQFAVDGTLIGTDSSSPYSVTWNTTTATNSQHVVTATAFDAAGNNAAASATVTVSNAAADTTPPTVSMTAPADGSTVNATIQVTASAGDDVGVAGVQFLLDGTTLGQEDTSAPYQLAWNSTTASNGPHQLSARARDAAGNTAESPPITVTVSNATPPPGLVLALGFNETSGTAVLDSSGMGNNGTISGATRTTGHTSGGLSFNGTSNTVSIPDAASLDLTSGMTIEVWVRPSKVTSYTPILLKERGSDLSYALMASDGASRPPAAYVAVGTADTGAAGTAVLPLNTWSHLAATFDGTTLRLYVNGALVRSQAASGNITTSTGVLRLGGMAAYSMYFGGLMDDVRIYNRALSASEITTDMNTGIQ